MSTTIRPGTRAAGLIAALADAQAFVTAHPGLPLGRDEALTYVAVKGSEADRMDEIDAIAAMIGGEAACRADTGGYWTVTRDFGSGVRYKAFCLFDEADLSDFAMAARRARTVSAA
jgi:hypothetical protein